MRVHFPSNSLAVPDSGSLHVNCVGVAPLRSRRPITRSCRFAALLFLACLTGQAPCLFVSAQAPKVDAATVELKRGKLLYAKRDLVGAIDSYNKAIELRPDWAVAYVRRGYVRWMQGDVDRAVADYDTAMALDPASTRDELSIAEAYISHGSLCRRKQQIESAIADFDKAITLSPKVTETFLLRAQARLLNDEMAGAIADLDHVIANEKQNSFRVALAYADRSLAKRLLGKGEAARVDMLEGLALVKGREHIVEEQVQELITELLVFRQMRARERKIIARIFAPIQ